MIAPTTLNGPDSRIMRLKRITILAIQEARTTEEDVTCGSLDKISQMDNIPVMGVVFTINKDLVM